VADQLWLMTRIREEEDFPYFGADLFNYPSTRLQLIPEIWANASCGGVSVYSLAFAGTVLTMPTHGGMAHTELTWVPISAPR